ncbi:MAG: hypothetical protein HQ556_12390 [Candidatus Marinimicrobia bacterium]|nr:hypothetical protein [Candidatus Neomarinimicrobiota bacterium]
MKSTPWKVAFFTSVSIFSIVLVVQFLTLYGLLDHSKYEDMYEHQIRVSRNLEILDKIIGIMDSHDVRIHKSEFLAEFGHDDSTSDFKPVGRLFPIPPEKGVSVFTDWDVWVDFDADGYMKAIRAPGMYTYPGELKINEDSPRSDFLHYEKELFDKYLRGRNIMWWGMAMVLLTVMAALFLIAYEFKRHVFNNLIKSFLILSASTVGIVISIIWYAFWVKDTVSYSLRMNGSIVPENTVSGLEASLIYYAFASSILFINLVMFALITIRWVKLSRFADKTAT